jgi:hypothetical protein
MVQLESNDANFKVDLWKNTTLTKTDTGCFDCSWSVVIVAITNFRNAKIAAPLQANSLHILIHIRV